MNKLLTIGEVAKLFDIAASQIRFYERKGLLMPTYMGDNGYRYYDFMAIDKLSVIVLLRDLEIPVSEIKEIIEKDRQDIQEHILSARKKVVTEIDRLNNLLKKVDYMTHELDDFEDGKIRTLACPERRVLVLSKTDVLNMSEREVLDFFLTNDLPFTNIKHDAYYIQASEEVHLYCMHDRDNHLEIQDASSYHLKAGRYLEWCTEIEDSEAIERTLETFEQKALALGYQLVGEKIIINELSSILYSTTGIPIKVQRRIQDDTRVYVNQFKGINNK